MSTVDKGIADAVIAGEYPEDCWVRIVKYTNAWGGESYGLENSRTLGKYQASDFVINPTVYWEQ
jgi:hypothetical protein